MNFLFLVQFASQLPPLFFFFSLWRVNMGYAPIMNELKCSLWEWSSNWQDYFTYWLSGKLFMIPVFWIHVVCSQLETLSTSHLPRSLESWEMKLKPSVVSYHAMICKVGEYEANYMILVHKSLFSYTVNCSTECIKSN